MQVRDSRLSLMRHDGALSMPKSVNKMRKVRRRDQGSLSPNEAGKILNVTGEAVKQWIYKGQLPAVKLPNGYYRIKHDDLAKFLEARQTAAQMLTLAGSDQGMQGILGAVAKEANLAFTVVSETTTALKQFKAQAPNLLVVDIDGFKDGWKLIRKVRSSPRFGSPKVLLLSRKGLTDKETAEAVRLGVSGCLEGPEALAPEVRRLLD